MRRLILIWLSAFWVVGSAAAEEKHCQLQSDGEMPATFDGRDIVTEAQINGKPVRLIVDTGAWGTLLFESEARKLGLVLRRTGATAYGVGGETQVYSVRVKEFRLGSLSERDADLVATGLTLGDAQGLLGAKFLMQVDVEFDLPHGKIRFFKPHDCAGDEVVYWGEAYAVAPIIPTPDDRIVVRVRVNGTPIVAEMDSGASGSVLTTGAAAKAGVTPKSAGFISGGATHGLGRAPTALYSGRFDSFSFGEETIRNAELGIADLFAADKATELGSLVPTPVSDQPQMLLGADFLRAHRVFIAREQHRVYVTYEGGPVFMTPPPPTTSDTPATK
jgi:predicted aspartyl protease